jgi:lysophospholipase L1-like esterase
MDTYPIIISIQRFLQSVQADTFPFLPPLTAEYAGIYVLHIFLVITIFSAVKMIIRLSINKSLGIHTKPFSSNEEHSEKILILGDSTAVGTGAASVNDSIAGRLAHDFPKAQIVNRAVNGACIRDLPKQILGMEHTTFMMIIVSVGGNDVWHLSRTKTIEETLLTIFPKLQAMSPKRVFFLTYNNISRGPLFPSWISWFLSMHAARIEKSITQCAQQYRVPVICLFEDTVDNPFLRIPEKLFAADGIHPNSDGYRLWYNHMWRRLREEGFHS